MEFKSLLEMLAGDLNDAEEGRQFTAWPESLVRAWVQEGYDILFDQRPELFLQQRVMQVTPCSEVQEPCDDCESVYRVLGQATESGRLLRRLRERSLKLTFEWTAPPCRPPQGGKGFELSGYSLDQETDNLYVYPKVPAGVDVYLLVECSVRPDAMSEDGSVPRKFAAAVAQWVLWRAKSRDAEYNSDSYAIAKEHKSTFYELIIGAKRAEDAMKRAAKQDNTGSQAND